MEYRAYNDLAGHPNVIVDGSSTDDTVLVLSHWPGSETPVDLQDDLSTQIAFRALDAGAIPASATAVSNNHFDEDGLCGMFAVLHPDVAEPLRGRLIDVASAGDFGTFESRDAARAVMALQAFTDPARSPLPIAGLPYPAQTEILYAELLERLPGILDDIDSVRRYWQDEDDQLTADIAAIGDGRIRIEEIPDLDLAIVTGGQPHPMALHNATRRMRILMLDPSGFELRYRYETWVMYRSERLLPRVDMTPLASELSGLDSSRWTAGSNDELTPALRPSETSSLSANAVRATVISFLRGQH